MLVNDRHRPIEEVIFFLKGKAAQTELHRGKERHSEEEDNWAVQLRQSNKQTWTETDYIV